MKGTEFSTVEQDKARAAEVQTARESLNNSGNRSDQQAQRQQAGQPQQRPDSPPVPSHASQPSAPHPDSQPGAGHPAPMVVDSGNFGAQYAPNVPYARPDNPTQPNHVEEEGLLERIREGLSAGSEWARQAAEKVRHMPWGELLDELDGKVGRGLNRLPGVDLEEYESRDPDVPRWPVGQAHPNQSYDQTQRGYIPGGSADLEPTQGYNPPSNAPQWDSPEEAKGHRLGGNVRDTINGVREWWKGVRSGFRPGRERPNTDIGEEGVDSDDGSGLSEPMNGHEPWSSWSRSYPPLPSYSSSGPGLPPGVHHFPILPELPTQPLGRDSSQDGPPTIPASHRQDGGEDAVGEDRTPLTLDTNPNNRDMTDYHADVPAVALVADRDGAYGENIQSVAFTGDVAGETASRNEGPNTGDTPQTTFGPAPVSAPSLTSVPSSASLARGSWSTKFSGQNLGLDELSDDIEEPDTMPFARATTADRTGQEPRPGAEVLADGLRENASNEAREVQAREVMTLIRARREAEREYRRLQGISEEDQALRSKEDQALNEFLDADAELLDVVLDQKEAEHNMLLDPIEIGIFQGRYEGAVRNSSERLTRVYMKYTYAEAIEASPEEVSDAYEAYRELYRDVYKDIADTHPDDRDNGIKVVEREIRETLKQRAMAVIRTARANEEPSEPEWMRKFRDGGSGTSTAQPERDIAKADTAHLRATGTGFDKIFVPDPTTEHRAVRTAPTLVDPGRIASVPTERQPSSSKFLNGDDKIHWGRPEADSQPTPEVRKVDINRGLDIIYAHRRAPGNLFTKIYPPYNQEPVDGEMLEGFSNSFDGDTREARAYHEVFAVIRNIGARSMGFGGASEIQSIAGAGEDLNNDLNLLATLLIYKLTNVDGGHRHDVWPIGMITEDTKDALKRLIDSSINTKGMKKRHWINWVLTRPGHTREWAVERVLDRWTRELDKDTYVVKDGKLERITPSTPKKSKVK